jgi:hypothetical protein
MAYSSFPFNESVFGWPQRLRPVGRLEETGGNGNKKESGIYCDSMPAIGVADRMGGPGVHLPKSEIRGPKPEGNPNAESE